MRRNIEVRGSVALLAIGLATSWSTTAAFAACGMPAVGGGGSGPPSISITETSTTQVLEQVRRRTQEAQQQPIQVANVAAADEPTVEAASAQASSASGSASGPAQTAKKKPKSGASSPPVAAKTYDKEPTASYGAGARTTAVWSQAFLGYERHENLAPGNLENPTRTAKTAGGLVGADWTQVTHSNGVRALQYGVFTGYSDTNAKNSDTRFTTIEGSPTSYTRTNSKEEIDGPFVGAYVALVQDAWTFDTTFKADFFDLNQSSFLTQTCASPPTVFGTQTGSASVTNYMIQANASRRYELTERHWWEPTAGVRYTYTDFGSDPSTTVFNTNDPQAPGRLGLEDGYALRLQFGARLGERVETADGYIWTTTVGAFLYSDVLVNGFDSISGQTGEFVGPVDEGELRVLGQLETRLNVGNGTTYLFQAEVRGGDDVFGAAGQIGVRYEW